MTKAFAIALLKQDIQNSKQKISYYHNEVGIISTSIFNVLSGLSENARGYHFRRVV